MRTPIERMLVDALPVASAIGIFGVIYGATASAVMEPALAVSSSLLMFSGAAQFAVVGLLGANATPVAIVLAVATLGLRHIPLAALVRPRLDEHLGRRALLALVLTDETAGLAVASERSATRTLAVVGTAAYTAFAVGTVAGVLGADLLGLAPLAGVVFVLLFIGLSSLTCRSSPDVVRACAAAAATAGLVSFVPQVGAAGAIAVAAGVSAVPRGRRP